MALSPLARRLLLRSGVDPDKVHPLSKLGRTFRKSGIEDTPELQRIRALPRRRWEDIDPEFVEQLTEYLKRPAGDQKLRPVQAAALSDLYDFGGLFGSIRVGGGKTLISLLAATVLGAERPLLLVPAKLKDKTAREMRDLRSHWRIAGNLRIESYELLGRVSGKTILEQARPDLLICDEVHKIRNHGAAVSKRVKRYMHENEDVRFVGLSGTITKRSIVDFHHILGWSIPKLMPLPWPWIELISWADALDEKVALNRRISPGALIQLFNKEEIELAQFEDQKAARRAYQRRLNETPGVVTSQDDRVSCSLSISAITISSAGRSAVDDAFKHLRWEWETPDGHPVADPVAFWRHCRELAIGCYYRWQPRPPPEWLDPRRLWCKFVRETLKSDRTVDSELEVARKHQDAPVYIAWKEVRDTFVPNVEAVWMDHVVLQRAKDWMGEGPGIVWVEHIAFGHKLAELTGVDYYAAGGVNADKEPIELHDPELPLIASIASNSEGRNLQAWNRNLIISAMPTGILWEQMIGRTHRDGQQADEVTVDVIVGCAEQVEGFEQARRDAQYLQDTLGIPQKLIYADVMFPTSESLTSSTSDGYAYSGQQQDYDNEKGE